METQVENQAAGMPAVQFVVPKPVTLNIPQPQRFEKEGREVVAFAAGGVSIVTHQDYLVIGERLQAVLRAKATIVKEFKESKDAAFQAHRKVCALERKLLEPLERVEAECNRKVKTYLLDKADRERREAEERRKKAEEEARVRAADEKRRQDDERLKVAQQLEESGFKEEADSVLAQDLPPPPVVPVFVKPQEKEAAVPGQHLRTKYYFVVDDIKMIAAEVIAGRQPTVAILPNQQYFDKLANAAKGELRIPGGHVESDATVVNKKTKSEKEES